MSRAEATSRTLVWQPTWSSIAAMLLLAVIWGLSIPITKLALDSLPPLTLTAARFAVAAPLLLIMMIGRPQISWRALPAVAGLGILGIGVGQVTQTLGVVETTASIATIVSATIPVFVVIFAAARLQQSITARQWLGILAAFAGIVLVAVGDGSDIGDMLRSSAVGVALLLLSAVTIAFYFVWSVELTSRYGMVTVAAWSTLFGFLALLPWSLWEMSHQPVTLTATGFVTSLYLGLGVTVAGLLLWLAIMKTVPARIAASVQFLQPVVGVAAAALMFHDPLGPVIWIGVALVLSGVAMTTATR